MITEIMENYLNEQVGQSPPAVIQCREPSRLPWKKILHSFNKNKAIKRYVRSHFVNCVPNCNTFISVAKDFIDYYRNNLSVVAIISYSTPTATDIYTIRTGVRRFH